MNYKLSTHDLEFIDTLKEHNKVWSTTIANMFGKDIPDVSRLRILADAIIKLEDTKDMYLKELTEYKIQFGELRQY